MWIWVFWILCFVIIFLEKLSYCHAKNNPTEKQIDEQIQANSENSLKSVKFIITNCKDRFKL